MVFAPMRAPLARLDELRRSNRWVARGAVALPYVLIVAAVMALVGYHIDNYPKLSPFDEQAHVDYLYKVRDLHVPRANELMGQEALNEESCRGFYSGYIPPTCLNTAKGYDPAWFQFGGVSAATGHAPLYYAVTALVGAPLTLLPGLENVITAARVATGLWLAAGFCVFWWIMRLHGASRLAIAGTLGVTMSASQVLLPASTINTDSTAFLGGAVMLAVALRWRRRWLLFALSLLVTTLKATNVVAVTLAALYLLVTDWNHERVTAEADTRRRMLRRLERPFLLMLGAGIAAKGWALIQEWRALPRPKDAAEIGGEIANGWVVALKFFPPTNGAALEMFFYQNQAYLLGMTFTSAFLICGALGAALLLRGGTVENRLGWLGLGGMIFGPFMVMVLIKAGADIWYAPPGRYGVSLIPFLLAPVALCARTIPQRAFTFAFGAALVLVTVAAIHEGEPPPPDPDPAAVVAPAPEPVPEPAPATDPEPTPAPDQ